MSKKRRYFSADQKVVAIRKHLLERTPVSDICDELNITTTLFYRWQKEFFENGSRAFTKDNDSNLKKVEKENTLLQATTSQKNDVIAELVAENISLKKKRGLI
ncbi:transposase [Lentisphaera marina]|uniref:transposase n=1 Tax=Lentisphaera marina TaxID=1111041 RepID=UPI002365310B|nr:transposase [Lentisphaera marina]MDD7983569.1 transposase [Lentisphaera marina]MDD7984969.1 transposase [Lentisphaera marina]MDD7985230.1 transposase [Lentisphaera marina]MDD7985364.1 transposase [Lentisphaera marina]MDD7986468.1 transposase [Lentisphaera marina]